MSNFKNNFSELLLLANKNIVFEDSSSDFRFELVPMKVEDMFFNEDVGTLLGLLDTELEELSKNFNTKLDSYLTFLIMICTLGSRRSELKELSEAVKRALTKILPKIEFNGIAFIIDGYLITPEIFDQIILVAFKILGREKIIINDEDDEFSIAEKKAQLRAQQIRKKGKKKDKEGSKMEEVLLALIYEFPQYQVKDLFQLNIFTFNYLFSKVGQIANYEVSKIAAGNGLTKKHKYLIGKK